MRAARGMLVFATIAFACGGTASSGPAAAAADGGAGSVAPAPMGLTAISLSQTDVHIPVGTMTAFAVTGTFADGTRGDVTSAAQVSTSNAAVATVAHGHGAQIQITGAGAGSATITVTVGSLAQSCAVTVTPAY